MPVSADYDVDLRGLLFRAGTTYALTEITGLDLPDVDVTTTQRSGAHGAFVDGQWLKERTVVLNGRARATSGPAMPGILNALKAAFAPAAADVPLTLQIPGMGIVYANVKPVSLRYKLGADETAVGYADFLATVTAGDPRIYANILNTAVGSPTGTGGIAINGVTFPFQFSANPDGSLSAVNLGNFSAPAQVILQGPLTNPGIVNTTTGESLQVSVDIATGETLIIDTETRTVMLNGASRYSSLVAGSKFINLAPGANTFTSISTSGTGSISISWRNTWI